MSSVVLWVLDPSRLMEYTWPAMADKTRKIDDIHVGLQVIQHLLRRQLLLRWYLRQQRVRVRVMIGFLVRGRVRIKIKIRVEVRVWVTFNVRVYHWSNCHRSKCGTFDIPPPWPSVAAEPCGPSGPVAHIYCVGLAHSLLALLSFDFVLLITTDHRLFPRLAHPLSKSFRRPWWPFM